MPSGAGEPAIDDLGVFSLSLRRPMKLSWGARWGVAVTARPLVVSCVPFTERDLPPAVSMTAIWAMEMGSFGEPS